MSNEIIRYEDVDLKEVTVSGFSANGNFYGDSEHRARWSSCTHVACGKCGADAPKSRTICSDCREKIKIEKWQNAAKLPHDKGEDCFYSEALDEYFDSIDEAEERCDEDELNMDDLLLYHCRREDAPQVDLDDLYCDLTPEEHDTSDMYTAEIEAACNELNRLLRAHPVNCFMPSKIAVGDDL